MSGELEITPGEQQTFQQSIKINNFRKFMEFNSKYIEVFPGKKISFVIHTLPENSSTGYKYTEYVLQGGSWTAITANDKFISLELRAGDQLRLAGKVEIILGETDQSFTFGDPGNDIYSKFPVSGNFIVNPKKVAHIRTSDGKSNDWAAVAASLFHLKLSDAEEKTNLEIKFTLHSPGEITEKTEVDVPDSLESQHYVNELNTKIMNDESTADLKISCGEEDNKKIFNVHKNFFCASSPVFRAAIESDMVEGRTKEIYIKMVDVKTVLEMIYYVYTGDFTGADLNVQSVAWVADKYNLPGMMDLLCFRMTGDVEDENIADMLIAAGRHESDQLKEIAMDKLRKKREILTNSAFRGKLQNYQNILFELIQEL